MKLTATAPFTPRLPHLQTATARALALGGSGQLSITNRGTTDKKIVFPAGYSVVEFVIPSSPEAEVFINDQAYSVEDTAFLTILNQKVGESIGNPSTINLDLQSDGEGGTVVPSIGVVSSTISRSSGLILPEGITPMGANVQSIACRRVDLYVDRFAFDLGFDRISGTSPTADIRVSAYYIAADGAMLDGKLNPVVADFNARYATA